MDGNKKFDYQGAVAEWLSKREIKIWANVKIITKKGIIEGIIIPRGEQGDDKHLVIKLRNGYNIGIHIDNIEDITIKNYLETEDKIQELIMKKDPKKPTAILLGTGGTLASRIDYKTGAVLPAFTPKEIFNFVPELNDICNLETKEVFQKLSENINPKDWITIATEIINSIEKINPAGIIIAHGTDTMHFTSAALSFILSNIDRPIVLVGSQRSSDRPSSDAAINLLNSAYFAVNSDIAEVVVCMHGQSGDTFNLIHRGTRVRKMHTSRRDAFKTVGDYPIAKIKDKKITYTGIKYNKRNQKKGVIEVNSKLDEKIGLVYIHPGFNREIIDYYLDKKYSGIVIAGTGLGHTNYNLIESFERAKEENIPIFMTSQCFWGFVGMTVYETGRLLLDKGVIPLGNMLPETALVKAMWVLGHTKEVPFVKELMQKNLAGEITERETFDSFLIFQGKIDKRLTKLLEKEK